MLEMPRYALLKTQRPSRRGQWRRVGRKHAGFRKQRDDDDDDDVRHSSSRHCDTPRERREASRKTGSSAHPRPWFLPLGSPTHHLLLHQTPRPTSHQTPLQSRGRVCGRAVAAAYKREMLLMAAPAADEHQKRRRGRPLCADLLLNCDLPPPAKLFGPFPALQRAGGTDEKGDGGKDVLLRALRLSQSRAREAEEKLAAAAASSGGLAALLVRDSVALSAHRRWVMMLEAENSALRAGGGGAAGAEPEEEEDGAGAARHRMAAAWWVALAVCVGLALGNLLL